MAYERMKPIYFIMDLWQFRDKTLVLPRLGTSAGYFREPAVWSYTNQMGSDLCTGHAAYLYLTSTMWDVLYVSGNPWRLLQATGEHINTGCFVFNQVHLVPLGIFHPTECQCLVEAPR